LIFLPAVERQTFSFSRHSYNRNSGATQIPIHSDPKAVSTQNKLKYFCLKIFNCFPLDLHLRRKKSEPGGEGVKRGFRETFLMTDPRCSHITTNNYKDLMFM
jgi:hypothetical protein